MLPQYLKVQGFRSYLEEKIDFTKFGNLFCVVGFNGHGKSSIIEMITTALYWRNSCTDSKGAGMDACINTSCDSFVIEFCFEMNGVEYLIITRKTKGESRELEFYIDGVNQSEKVTETQEKINEVLKMNYDTFLDTVCLGQGQASRFMQKKPAERKETFSQILDISKYEKYEKEAKENKKEYKNKIDEIANQIGFIEKYICDESEVKDNIKNKKESLVVVKSNINIKEEQLEEITKQKIEFENKKKQHDFIMNTRNSLHDKCNKLKETCGNIQDSINEIHVKKVDYADNITTLEADIDNIHNEITSIKESISELKTKKEYNINIIKDIKSKYDKLDKYNKSVCEFCYNEITPEHKNAHLQKFKCEWETASQQNDIIDDKIKSLIEQGKNLSIKGKNSLEEKKKLESEQMENERNIVKIKSLKEKLEYQQNELKEYQQQYEENLKIELVEIENCSFDDTTIKNEISMYRQQETKINNEVALLQEKLKKSQENKDKIEQLKDKEEQLKVLYNDFGSLATAFGKSGIPANIIEHDIPEIETETNKVLSVLSDNSMSINYVTTKATAKGKKSIDTLDIVVNDMNGSRSYETYSGGEKFRVDFACHIGLAKFLTKRSGATIDFLIIDEGLGSQDDMAKQKFIDSIKLLSSMFKQIMVITHIQDLQNSFVNKVLVQKNQLTGSHVDLI